MIETTIGLFRRHVTKVLNAVIYGHKFYVVTRYGKPVAMVVPYSKKWEEIEKSTQLPEDEEPERIEIND